MFVTMYDDSESAPLLATGSSKVAKKEQEVLPKPNYSATSSLETNVSNAVSIFRCIFIRLVVNGWVQRIPFWYMTGKTVRKWLLNLKQDLVQWQSSPRRALEITIIY